MTTPLRRLLPLGLAALASVWMSTRISTAGDWPGDSWPAVQALSQGQVAHFLGAKAMMGPFSILVQAPWAAVAPGGHLDVYRWASFPCVLAAGLLGGQLAGVARRRGVSTPGQILVGGLCVINPLTFQALQGGHPEEILTAALAVAAVVSAAEGRKILAALLLGLALASKQWAVIAILPALMALPDRRVRTALAAFGIAALLILPGLVSSPASFTQVHDQAAGAGRVVTPTSIWFPAATVKREVVAVHGETFVSHVHRSPALLGALSHPLIVALAFLLPVALALRRRSFALSGSDALALLALLALLRCALDPLNNIYYHEPLLLALIGWDAFASRSLPVRGLLGSAAAWFFADWTHHLTNLSAYNLAYIAVVVPAALAISAHLLDLHARETDFSPDEAQISGIQESAAVAD